MAEGTRAHTHTHTEGAGLHLAGLSENMGQPSLLAPASCRNYFFPLFFCFWREATGCATPSAQSSLGQTRCAAVKRAEGA